MVRYLNDVFLRSGHDAVSVHGFAITVVNATTGEPLSHHSSITNHRLTADHVVDVGPGAGLHGGEIVAQGTFDDILAEKRSITGRFLSGEEEIPVPAVRRKPARRRQGTGFRPDLTYVGYTGIASPIVRP